METKKTKISTTNDRAEPFIEMAQKQLQDAKMKMKQKSIMLKNFLKFKIFGKPDEPSSNMQSSRNKKSSTNEPNPSPTKRKNQINNSAYIQAHVEEISKKIDLLVSVLEGDQRRMKLDEVMIRNIIKRLEQLLATQKSQETLISVCENIIEVQKLLQNFNGTKLEDNYFIIDSKINELMLETDAANQAAPYIKEWKKELLVKLNECSEEFDRKCTEAPKILTEYERQKKLDQIAALKSDLDAITKEVREFQGAKDAHEKMDEELVNTFKEVRRVDDGSDDEVAKAKRKLISEVQITMSELETNYNKFNDTNVIDADVIVHKTNAKENLEIKGSIKEQHWTQKTVKTVITKNKDGEIIRQSSVRISSSDDPESSFKNKVVESNNDLSLEDAMRKAQYEIDNLVSRTSRSSQESEIIREESPKQNPFMKELTNTLNRKKSNDKTTSQVNNAKIEENVDLAQITEKAKFQSIVNTLKEKEAEEEMLSSAHTINTNLKQELFVQPPGAGQLDEATSKPRSKSNAQLRKEFLEG